MRDSQASAALWLIVVLAFSFLVLSCSKKEQTASPTPAQSAAPAQPAPAAASPPAPSAPPASTQTSAPAAAPQTAASSPAAIQSQDANQPGIVADVIQAKRAEGVLSVRVRFRNTSGKGTRLEIIISRDYEKFYVTAAIKKYFILKDADGTYLTPNAAGNGNLGVDLEPGQAYTWWAKFPAPPDDVKKMTLITPITPPFEDVPISD
jgi:hypothetical protein